MVLWPYGTSNIFMTSIFKLTTSTHQVVASSCVIRVNQIHVICTIIVMT